MLNTQKLLYILPDVAYIAELLPAKKEHSFTIQSFRQINGEFLDDNLFIVENVQKLLSKIEPDTYHLILPDFLFTNTILEIKETQEAKIKSYIKDELLPSLDLNKESHEIETFILTQYNQISKVQLTALEKSVLDPIVVGAKEHRIQIAHISPLSWTIKSVVSLEPSITVIQMGDMLYVAEHYIGVDQCTQALASEIENVVDTVKTLKGAQPSIQTMYLLSNELVESKLKDQASSILPIQQLSTFKEDDSQMPSYVRQIIESGMRTFDIPDYPVPSFALPKQPVGDTPVVKAIEEPEIDAKTESNADSESELPSSDPLPLSPPPVPSTMGPVLSAAELKTEIVKPFDMDLDDDDNDLEESPALVTAPAETLAIEASVTPALTAPTGVAFSKAVPAEKPEAEPLVTPPPKAETAVPASEPEAISSVNSNVEPDLHQFAHENQQKVDMIETSTGSSVTPKPPVIKNKSGTGNMLKMIFITLAVFSATVAVGVAIGLGVLSWSNGNTAEAPVDVSPSPMAETESTPEAVATPSPVASASASVKTTDTSVLVVNATTTAGYAGSTKTKLDQADYGTVRAANAKGDYEPGTYVLMDKENAELITALEKTTGLELEFATGYSTEDPQGTYDAVIVLAE